MRDEVEMNESRSWKQMVLLIECVTVCHCIHLHLLETGLLACFCHVIDNRRLLSRVLGFITWIQHMSFTQGANLNGFWTWVKSLMLLVQQCYIKEL